MPRFDDDKINLAIVAASASLQLEDPIVKTTMTVEVTTDVAEIVRCASRRLGITPSNFVNSSLTEYLGFRQWDLLMKI